MSKSIAVLILLGVTLGGCASYPDISQRQATYALQDTKNTELGLFSKKLVSNKGEQSGFIPLGEGEDAFAVRVLLAQKAQKSIDAQYYLLQNDEIGKLFLSVLLNAADRGVRVRLLLDGAGFRGFSDRKLATIDSHPNFQIRYFNPFKPGPKYLQFVTRLSVASRRMHNKSFIADNQVAVVGGRNIGNEYFAVDQSLAYGDLDSVSIGPVVEKVSTFFDLYWNSDVVHNISSLQSSKPNRNDIEANLREIRSIQHSAVNKAFLNRIGQSELLNNINDGSINPFWGKSEVLADSPEKVVNAITRTDLHMNEDISFQFKKAKEEIIIFNPYFIPGEIGTSGLIKLVDKGIRVKVFTNSLASMGQTAVYAHFSKYRERLLKGGVEIYEAIPVAHSNKSANGFKKADKDVARHIKNQKRQLNTLHAKSFIIDRKYVFIGSMNLDPRSVFENTEIGIVFDSPEMAIVMADWFEENTPTKSYRLSINDSGDVIWTQFIDGKTIVFEHEPETTSWHRFLKNLLKVVPMESFL